MQKLPKTYKGKMNLLRELVGDDRNYPPSEEIWQQILKIIDNHDENNENYEAIQERIRRETNRYKPSLPEPLLTRIYYQGVYYYLDPRNNLYEGDPGNVLVGNLVGHLKMEKDGIKVILREKEILTLPIIDVKEKELYGKTYYLNAEQDVYRGLHPGHKYLYRVGKLSHENKIILR